MTIEDLFIPLRDLKCKINKARLKNKDFSIISSNCNGGVILHDLGQRFNSPFVNLWILPKDYLKLLNNFDDYMKYDLIFVEDNRYNYPVAILKDIKLYFQHYESKDEARIKWEQRRKRIIRDNIFVLFSDRDGCTYNDLIEFEKVPFENKVVFTKQKHPELKSSFYIRGFENQPCVGICSEYRNRHSVRRYLDDFDYVKWLNGEK